ncbi:hypothetical protein [Streptomyces sp. NBC_01304]|uniref:hypothetical protein n=1 Tax=Streptomyces sp. NBC_01304 TaxID=2903818 RepID=UPI002E1265E4|nr:hypothetical protein OG430_18840 [Streptomyces sp. NBC_01304]
MTGMLRKMGDKALARLAPSATAQADSSFYRHCYCRERSDFRQLCHIVGGTTGCGSCQAYRTCGG